VPVTVVVRRIGVAAIAFAVCALAGCSGGSDTRRLDKPEYLRRIRAIERSGAAQRAWRLSGQIAAHDPPLSRASCRARTKELDDTLDVVLRRVERLRPPAEVEPLQRQFVAAARTSLRIVGRAADDVAAGRLHCGRPLNRRIHGLHSTARMRAVLRAYVERGYTFGLNSD
jgi:hypothetical protein